MFCLVHLNSRSHLIKWRHSVTAGMLMALPPVLFADTVSNARTTGAEITALLAAAKCSQQLRQLLLPLCPKPLPPSPPGHPHACSTTAVGCL
jgi:hypothetical protein